MGELATTHGEGGRPRFALQRVLLIDSYTAGRITELPVEGGTAIVSPNGRGKTSLLQLIPAFYGERPDRIVKPVSNQGNFARYYLPRSTSYVVFEYRRDDVECCAILCADASGDGVEYRFVRSGFQREWFVHDDETTLVANANLFERLKLRGVSCTRKLPLDQYRAIIQAKRSHGSDVKQHRRDILDYAYGPGTHPLLHIERIVFGMFMRKSNFVDLQRMIVATVTDATGKISLGAERKKIEAWPDAFESYAAVMAEASRMDTIQRSYDAVLAAEQELRNIHGRFMSIDRELEGEQLEKQREQDVARDGLATAEQEYLSARRVIQELIEKAERAARDANATLASLQQQHQNYHKQDIEAKAALLDREREIEQNQQRLASRKAALLSELSNIEDEYRKILDGLTLQHKDREVAFERQRSAAKEASQSRLDALQAENRQQEDAARQVSLADEKEIQIAVSRANQMVGEATVRLNNPQAAAEFVEIAEQQQAKVDETHARQLDVIEREGEAKKLYEQKRAAFAQAENQLRNLNVQVTSENRKLDSLLMQASPDENSVLYLLRDKRPDWTQDIAKVLREDILTRVDLSPVIGALQDSVYGLQVDLESLDTPLVADELAIQREIGATREELQRLASRVEQQEAILIQSGAERERAEETLAHRTAETAMAKSARSSAEQQLKTARLDVQRSRDAAKEAARQALADAQRALDAAQQQMSAHRGRLNQEIETLTARYQQRVSGCRQELVESIEEIGTKETEEKKRYESAASQIDEERKAKLKANGVDTIALAELERQIAEAIGQLKTIADSRDLVHGWKRWLEVDWSRKHTYEDEVARAQKEKADRDEDLRACEKTWLEDANRRKQLIENIGRKLTDIKGKREQVT
ncbi:ATP-binding protein, partial [Paraburkholderia terrae]